MGIRSHACCSGPWHPIHPLHPIRHCIGPIPSSAAVVFHCGADPCSLMRAPTMIASRRTMWQRTASPCADVQTGRKQPHIRLEGIAAGCLQASSCLDSWAAIVRCMARRAGMAWHAADASAGWMPMGCHPGPSFSWDGAWTLSLASTRTRAYPRRSGLRTAASAEGQTGELVT